MVYLYQLYAYVDPFSNLFLLRSPLSHSLSLCVFLSLSPSVAPHFVGAPSSKEARAPRAAYVYLSRLTIIRFIVIVRHRT